MVTTDSLTVHAPATSPNDEPIALSVSGASPGARVTIRARLVDDAGTEWRSETTFLADGEGTVDLSADAPESGAYEGVAQMGWLWSMTTEADTPFAALGEHPTIDVDLRATTPEQSTERTITRVVYDDRTESRPVDAPELVGDVSLPEGDGPHPGVMVLHGSSGGAPERFSRLLATHGFAVLALTYFGADDPIPDELGHVPLSYVDDAAGWFRGRSFLSGDSLGVVGMSRGGELALLVGSRFGWVGAVVSYSGSGVVYDTPSGTPAWTEDGDPVPHLSGEGEPEWTDDGQVITRPVLERGLDAADEASLDAATIPVEETDGPILLLSGGDDLVWPAQRLSAIAATRLTDSAFPHEFDHRSYEGAGHLISVPYAPHPARGGGTPAGTARAAEDSWPIVLRYLGWGTAPPESEPVE
jgi:dienelactone hydrolase